MLRLVLVKVSVPHCEPGGRQVVRSPSYRHPNAFGGGGLPGVKYVVRETVCGNFVYVTSSAIWNRYRNAIQDPERDAERTRLRALRKLRERVLSLGADRLLTLTYRENMQDYALSKEHVRKFVARVRKSIPGWKFVAVPEQQERGAYHWHFAISGFMDVKIVRSAWIKIVGDGNIDISPPRKGGAAKLADYISKYLGKGFDVHGKVRYSHFYMTSRGLTAVSYSYDLIGFTQYDLQSFMTSVVDARGSSVRTRWWKDDHYETGGCRSW